jgi:DNA mismatch repair protein MutL
MSDVIQLLPDTVANQIAAGEVIQRPASVIKELVENAVDAGARHIDVVIVDAGRTSIQVIDDGKGMSETDARLAFERHATSKIRHADDLFALHTMGFRGEALPSIAAVAQVELLTRMADDEVGTRLVIAASKVLSQEPVACPVGCHFKVENLFYNVPVRRKFLKSNATELNNILTAFERIVLVYPDIAFTLHSGNSELMNLRSGSLLQRITDVFGKHYGQDLLPVEVKTAVGTVTGFVGKPEAAKRKGAHQYLFVNGRYMKHPYFHKAVLSAYERLIGEGTQPPYLLYFDVAPADIDVNIHPTKTEIKFENEQLLWQILVAAVKDALGRFCEVPAIDFDTEGRPDIPVFDPHREAVDTPRVTYNPAYNPFKTGSGTAAVYTGQTEATPARTEQPSAPPSSLFDDPVAPPSLITEKSPVHYQYKGRYIMTAVKSGLMIVDQYRASLRILYEKYRTQTADRVLVPQRVLFPEAVSFSQAEAARLEAVLPQLSVMGFELTSLGGGSYAVNAIPAGVDGDPVALVQSIVSESDVPGTPDVTTATDRLALSLARATAVPYGQILSNDEMEGLINQLFACSNVNYTPDGRAVLSILPQTDIEQLLG